MAEIKVEREPGYDDGHRRRRSSWPGWLLAALGLLGIMAVANLSDRPATQADRPAVQDTFVTWNGQRLSNAGATSVRYPEAQMVSVGTSREGIELYRHKAQPFGHAGGGGGRAVDNPGNAGAAMQGNPIFMKTGDGIFLPLKAVK